MVCRRDVQGLESADSLLTMKAMKKALLVLVVLGVLLVLGVFLALGWGIRSYNQIIPLSAKVESQWAQVQNVYQRRADLIPNLVATVSGAANFEKSTLIAVTEARASVGNVKMDPKELLDHPEKFAQFEQAQDRLSSALSRLLVVVERYPDLKANSNFLELQSQLEGTENRIAVERGRFNEAVQAYNVEVQKVPQVFLARAFGFTPKPYFQAKPEAQEAPKVNFNFDQAPAK